MCSNVKHNTIACIGRLLRAEGTDTTGSQTMRQQRWCVALHSYLALVLDVELFCVPYFADCSSLGAQLHVCTRSSGKIRFALHMHAHNIDVHRALELPTYRPTTHAPDCPDGTPTATREVSLALTPAPLPLIQQIFIYVHQRSQVVTWGVVLMLIGAGWLYTAKGQAPTRVPERRKCVH
jgi:hypothetical protein